MSTPQSTAPRTRENQAMNLVRVAAALLVVFGHVRLLFFRNYADAPHSAGAAAAYAVTSIGAQAVIVFFVLSGYWVGGAALRSMRSRSFTWLDYGTSRLTRLWLVLLPALLLTLAVDSLGHFLFPAAGPYLRPSVYSGIPAHPTVSPTTFLGNLAFLQYLVPTGLHVQVFGTDQPLWSLAYEFWYYLAFPAMLLALRKGPLGKRILSATVAVAALAIGGWPVVTLFPTWLLGAGVAAAQPWVTARLLAVGRLLPWLQVFLAVVTLLMAVVARLVVSLWGAYVLAATAAVFIASLTLERAWTSLPGRLFTQVSRLASSSYSLYAAHMPLVVLGAAWLVPDANRRWLMTPGHVAAALAVITALVLIAVGFAWATERRTNDVRRRLRPRRA